MADVYDGYDFSEEDRRRAQKDFWQALGFALLSNANRNPMEALGRAGIAGMGAKQAAYEDMMKAKLGTAQLKRMNLDNQEADLRLSDARAMRTAKDTYMRPAVPGFTGEDREGNQVQYPAQPAREDWQGYQAAVAGVNPQLAIQMDPFVRRQAVRTALAGPVVGASGGVPATQTPADAGSPYGGSPAQPVDPSLSLPGAPNGAPGRAQMNRAIAEKMLEDSRKLRAAGLTDEADALVTKARDFMPKSAGIQVANVAGKPALLQRYEDGSIEVLPYSPERKITFQDAGGKIIPTYEDTAEPVPGRVIPKTATPGSAVEWARFYGPEFHEGNAVTRTKDGRLVSAPVEGYQKPADATTTRELAAGSVASDRIGRAIEAATAAPQAFGPQNVFANLGSFGHGDEVMQYIDPKGIDARALVANVGSQVFHDRSGANVTMSEAPRLKPFIPSVNDKPEIVVKKLRLLQQEVDLMNTELARGSSIAQAASEKARKNRAPLSSSGPDTTPNGYKVEKISG